MRVVTWKAASGKLVGPWNHQAEPIYKQNGRHRMLLTTFDGKLMKVLYSPNDRDAKPRIFEMKDTGDTLKIVKEFTGKDLYVIITLDEWDSQSNSTFYFSKERCMNIR